MAWQIVNLFPNISQNYQARQSSSNKHRHLKWMCKKNVLCSARPWFAQHFVNVRGEFSLLSLTMKSIFDEVGFLMERENGKILTCNNSKMKQFWN